MKTFILAVLFVLSTIATGCPKAGQIVLSAGQCVLDTGVLATVVVDLASANYSALIASLVAQVGPAVVKCALQAIVGASPTATDAGVAPAYSPEVVARAKEMLATLN